jgi:endonuclease YncB( thermonuclease family)
MEHPLTFAHVVQIIDGDTAFVREGKIGYMVRFADCNCPEKTKDGYHEAVDFTTKAIFDKRVGLQNHHQQWDQYSRRLATVWYGPKMDKNLSHELIANGHAVPDLTAAPSPHDDPLGLTS